MGYFGGYILFARGWNLHPIDSHVAGAIGWSFMRLDAAWHEWVLVALAVVIDGVLAVSAQCGCCHHFCPYFLMCPFRFVFFNFIFFVGLHPVCCMYYSFLTPILHIILHGLLFVFCVLLLFFFFDISWCIYNGDYGFYLVGVLFCCLCTTTSLYIPYGPS